MSENNQLTSENNQLMSENNQLFPSHEEKPLEKNKM